MKKQLLLFLFALLPMLAIADDSGSCGDNVTYTFVSSTGTLTIQGSGEMTSNPWSSYKDDIKTVIIKEGVTSIGNNAFSSCYGLTSITIPNSVTSIGEWAFWFCSDLTSITIGNSVRSIGDGAFRGCSGLTSITIPNSVTSIGMSAFSVCSGLTSVTIGNSVTSIGDYAFFGCSGLPSITIPNSVTSIGSEAFEDCTGLTSVTIGSGVTYIGKNAFSCGIKLSTVNVNMNIPIEIDESVFEFTGENYSKDIIYLAATLNVPKGSKNLYSNVKGWKKFANIEEFDVTNIAAQYRSKDARIVDVYKLNGQRSDDVHRGVNIVRMSDGTTRKVVVK